MPFLYQLLKKLVPMTELNDGKAPETFERLKTERELVVINNDVPVAVLLSPERYEYLIVVERKLSQMLGEDSEPLEED